VAGGLFASTHPWKHPIAAAQVGLLRQLTVGLQQLATMHWLHGVPPGSSGQFPTSIG
jgi:hypothetical protein